DTRPFRPRPACTYLNGTVHLCTDRAGHGGADCSVDPAGAHDDTAATRRSLLGCRLPGLRRPLRSTSAPTAPREGLTVSVGPEVIPPAIASPIVRGGCKDMAPGRVLRWGNGYVRPEP